MDERHPSESRRAPGGGGSSRGAWALGALAGLGVGLVALLAVLWSLPSTHPGSWPLGRLPELQATLGEGDYEFLPHRRNVWVVNRRNGRIVHYRFIDTAKGTVERSHPAEIDQGIFSPDDCVFLVSERNLADFLWVCNRRTGDFQLWRRNVRDGHLVTDPEVVSSAQHLLSPVLPSPSRGGSGGSVR